MPQKDNDNNSNKKKKKNGGSGSGSSSYSRKPAHQNTFAFKHNPKSKKTDKILNSPNIHVCRRCYDKIEWRKTYRKYKPLTQPSKCNLCSKRNVKAAYHTICTSCTTSDKAKQFMTASSNTPSASASSPAQVHAEPQQKSNEQESIANVNDQTSKQQQSETAASKTTTTTTTKTTSKSNCYRVCAVCVKEPALHGEGDNEKNDIETMLANETGRLRLRDRRALERKLVRQQEEEKRKRKEERQKEKEEGNDFNDDEDEKLDNRGNNDNGGDDDDDDVSSVDYDDDDDDDDPFLKAVGGADKLLTGEAYQKKLLEQQS